eukprot:GFKZ01015412.1.p1 GENE.GFKZ01015412.1~~GFKZ01015412.1.p1  ORF type:complete len:189 (-),score=15.01 GFKZ01015412.1:1027-1593(-)
MSEYRYTPYPPINKEIPSTFPVPTCDPQVTKLPPAAAQPTLGEHPSMRYRGNEKHRSPRQPRPNPNLPYSKDHPEYTDRHSTPTPPHSQNRASSSSRYATPSTSGPPPSRHGKTSGVNGLHGGRGKGEERMKEGGVDKKDNGKAYGAPKTARRGSTIPRQGRVESVRSPLSRSSAGGYAGSSRSRGGH